MSGGIEDYNRKKRLEAEEKYLNGKEEMIKVINKSIDSCYDTLTQLHKIRNKLERL